MSIVMCPRQKTTIKFFRIIRYDLKGKNQTGKYIKYAVGEMIFVVIGIYNLALHTNVNLFCNYLKLN